MLKLCDKFKIGSDGDLNYILYELKPVKDAKTKETRHEWKIAGYYGKLSHALSGALNKHLIGVLSEEETIEVNSLIDTLNSLLDDIKKIKLER